MIFHYDICNRFNSFKISTIQIKPETKDFNSLLITAEISEKKFKFQKKYLINSIKINKEGKILNFNFTEENIEDKTKSNFTIFNQSYDSRGNLIKRLVIKSKESDIKTLPSRYPEFINGKIIEYGNYNKAYFPSTFKMEYFILNSFGDIKIFKTAESTNRQYNNRGFLTKETLKQTSFPYSKATPFSIYNLKFNSNFNIKSFEVIFPGDKNNTFYANPQNYEVSFDKYKGNKFIKKTIRKFSLDKQIKTFVSGRTIEREFSNDKVIKTNENFFEIKEKTEGLKENSRIYTSSRDVYNLNFDKNDNILKRNIVDANFLQKKDTVDKIKIFKSLKKVKYQYKGSKISNAEVTLFGYNKDKKLTKIRTLNINVADFDKTGAPLEIIIKSITPEAPSSDIEKTFKQNTTYILQDAIFGFRYFVLPNTDLIPELKKVSERGEIEEINFLVKEK